MMQNFVLRRPREPGSKEDFGTFQFSHWNSWLAIRLASLVWWPARL